MGHDLEVCPTVIMSPCAATATDLRNGTGIPPIPPTFTIPPAVDVSIWERVSVPGSGRPKGAVRPMVSMMTGCTTGALKVNLRLGLPYTTSEPSPSISRIPTRLPLCRKSNNSTLGPSSPTGLDTWKVRSSSPLAANTVARRRRMSKAAIRPSSSSATRFRLLNSPGPSPARPTDLTNRPCESKNFSSPEPSFATRTPPSRRRATSAIRKKL